MFYIQACCRVPSPILNSATVLAVCLAVETGSIACHAALLLSLIVPADTPLWQRYFTARIATTCACDLDGRERTTAFERRRDTRCAGAPSTSVGQILGQCRQCRDFVTVCRHGGNWTESWMMMTIDYPGLGSDPHALSFI